MQLIEREVYLEQRIGYLGEVLNGRGASFWLAPKLGVRSRTEAAQRAIALLGDVELGANRART